MAGDDDLLARLNALKPSSITLAPQRPSTDVQVAPPQSVEDLLAERLKSLRSGGSVPAGGRHVGVAGDASDSHHADPHTFSTVSGDSDKDWQQTHDDDDETLEELLSDLRSDPQWTLDPNDPKAIKSLLREANEALPDEEKAGEVDEDHVTGNEQAHPEQLDATHEGSAESNDDPDAGERNEQEEVDDYVRRVLAELEVEKKYGRDPSDDGDEQNDRTPRPDLDLPSTPGNMPEQHSLQDPPSYEDSELESRFSKLGLDLPSTPTTAPSAKAKAVAKTGLAKSNLPVYTDEDMDSWCCICNEDGEVRCLGCDGDIYCQSCWRDGHGNKPGQERGHKAVQYNSRGPAAAAA